MFTMQSHDVNQPITVICKICDIVVGGVVVGTASVIPNGHGKERYSVKLPMGKSDQLTKGLVMGYTDITFVILLKSSKDLSM